MWLLLALACGTPDAPPDTLPALPPGVAPGPAAPDAAALTPIRIGWQTTWATQGQLVGVLMHTDTLARNGFSGDFKGFPYGGPLNEGALAGEVDVLFTADQPALILASKAPNWGIIGRLMYNRVGMFVPPDSAVTAPAGLSGKRLAVPFGAAAQREALGAIAAAGLDPKKDVTVVNLGLEEIVGVVRAGATNGRWGDLDAAAAWDPTFAELETSGRARTIASSVVTSVVVMDDVYVTAHAGAESRFMTAMAMAYDVYRADPLRADGWFQEEAKRTFEPGVLATAAAVEPNLSATDAAGIRVHLTPEDVAGITTAARFMEGAGLLKAPLAVEGVVRPSATTPPPPGDGKPAVIGL
jgi:ABC-type nitrate/sulfonate/bicarbonate transport system substrate-binding protein